MKGLTLTQPWASLVVRGLKKIETRGWSTNFRGEFAIHAAKGFPKSAKELPLRDPYFQYGLHTMGYNSVSELPIAAVVGVAELVMCLNVEGKFLDFEMQDGKVIKDIHYQRPEPHEPEFHFGDYAAGRYMFFMKNIRALERPIPCKGALSFWNVPQKIEAEIREQLHESSISRRDLSNPERLAGTPVHQ